MLRLLFLLIGGTALRAKWPWLMLAALGCMAGAGGIVSDLIRHGTLSAPITLTGLFILMQGVIEGLPALSGTNRLTLGKSLLLITAGAGILFLPHFGRPSAAWLLSLLLLMDGGFRVISSGLMRCRRWQIKMSTGCGEFLLCAMIITDWPVPHHILIPVMFIFLLLGWSLNLTKVAWQIHRLPVQSSVATLELFTSKGLREPHGLDYCHPDVNDSAPQQPLNLYIWTPTGSGNVAGSRPWFDRWVAAIDHRGVVSTGHTSLAMGNEIYISLYPENDIELDLKGFLQTLRARQEFDVAGRLQPSLEQEIRSWCVPDRRISLSHYNQAALRNYWEKYATDTHYNLTSRNCSTSVIQALDVATEGLLGKYGLYGLLTVFKPDFWLLSLIRSRAEGMTWTPGLVMDYCQTLQRLLECPQRAAARKQASGWLRSLRQVRRALRGIH
ncbi:hypothetical protein [Pantoea sp. A4]|uniref:hypothetical protein n=1 Tax=Pantoea sp. A4 TaxID=1225184 RepID=UPI000685E835|nr:hypothetical protein [Pantoea sp. A4]